MHRKKSDLLIHYDEDAQELILYSIESTATSIIRSKGFGGVRPEIKHFQSMPAEEAEMKLGGLAFAFLDLGSHQKIGIRDYEAEADEAHKRFVEELEEEVKTNDAEAQYQLFLHLRSLAMRAYSSSALARAESLLQAAAAQGHKGAISSLEAWPLLKGVAERRIDRGPDA